MRLIEIELFNFKQYYGCQKFNLAGEKEQSGQNVTLIYGENGRGKTSIYRALMFCLYGIKVLSQDQNYEHSLTDSPNIYIVNLTALQEDYEHEKKGIDCYVRTVFTNNGNTYTLERGLFAIQTNNGKIIEEDKTIKLSIRGANGKIDDYDQNKIDLIDKEINSIIDPRVSEFFLFDGERIERLTKATREQKEEVAKGIRNLLRIDNLQIAAKALDFLENKINKELQKVSTGEYLKKLKEIEATKREINSVENQIIQNNDELSKAKKFKEQIDEELNRYDNIKELLRRRKDLEAKNDDLNEQKKTLQGEMRRFNQKACIMLAKDVLSLVSSDIDQKKSLGQIPPSIKKDLIEKILKEMKCICGREIKLSSQEYEEINKWKQESVSQAFESYIFDFYRQLGIVSSKIEGYGNDVKGLLAGLGNIDEQLDEIFLQLKQVQDELGDTPNIDITNKEKYRDELIKKIVNLENKNKELSSQFDVLNTKLEEAQRKCKELLKEKEIQNDLERKHQITQNAIKVLGGIKEKFIKDIIIELEKKSNEIFDKLIDETGKQNLKWIKINTDYSLEVLDWNNRPFLANISAGQRQVVSLSFITALAQTAGGTKVLEIPLFMDTPFGRLGGAHRDNLLDLIPNITPQWILLATETEFSTTEYKKLKETGKWGKVYILDAKGPGVTQVIEQQVSLFKPKR